MTHSVCCVCKCVVVYGSPVAFGEEGQGHPECLVAEEMPIRFVLAAAEERPSIPDIKAH